MQFCCFYDNRKPKGCKSQSHNVPAPYAQKRSGCLRSPLQTKNTAPGLVTQGGPFELQMIYSVAVSSSRRTIAPSAEQSAVQCWPTQAVPDAI